MASKRFPQKKKKIWSVSKAVFEVKALLQQGIITRENYLAKFHNLEAQISNSTNRLSTVFVALL